MSDRSARRAFPYQLLGAWRAAAAILPPAIRDALQGAMEIATANTPVLRGNVVVAIDVSGSMMSPLSGHRQGATTAVRCVDVAALIAACIQRKNPTARVLPFDTQAHATVVINPRDSVIAQAQQLAALCGGGTRVSAPVQQLNGERAAVDVLVIISDNESWADTAGPTTQTMREWAQLKARCPQARLICIDLQPYLTSQTVAAADLLHVGGFSDAVFDLLASAANGERDWLQQIAAIAL